jgi:PilZ domain
MPITRATPRHRRRLRGSLGVTPFFTADISAGGFGVEILRTPAPGTPVDGTIRLAGAEVPFAGLVIWARAGSPRLNLRGRIGVRFTSLPAAAAKLLAADTLLATT